MTGFVKKGFGEIVEVAGIEPASESISIEATTCLSSALEIPFNHLDLFEVG